MDVNSFNFGIFEVVAGIRVPSQHLSYYFQTKIMSAEEHEQLRANIWDLIYHSGPKSIEQLSSEMVLSVPMVVGLVDHTWFSVSNDLVSIATEGS